MNSISNRKHSQFPKSLWWFWELQRPSFVSNWIGIPWRLASQLGTSGATSRGYYRFVRSGSKSGRHLGNTHVSTVPTTLSAYPELLVGDYQSCRTQSQRHVRQWHGTPWPYFPGSTFSGTFVELSPKHKPRRMYVICFPLPLPVMRDTKTWFIAKNTFAKEEIWQESRISYDCVRNYSTLFVLRRGTSELIIEIWSSPVAFSGPLTCTTMQST